MDGDCLRRALLGNVCTPFITEVAVAKSSLPVPISPLLPTAATAVPISCGVVANKAISSSV
jgi:hypothetical protein